MYSTDIDYSQIQQFQACLEIFLIFARHPEREFTPTNVRDIMKEGGMTCRINRWTVMLEGLTETGRLIKAKRKLTTGKLKAVYFINPLILEYYTLPHYDEQSNLLWTINEHERADKQG